LFIRPDPVLAARSHDPLSPADPFLPGKGLKGQVKACADTAGLTISGYMGSHIDQMLGSVLSVPLQVFQCTGVRVPLHGTDLFTANE